MPLTNLKSILSSSFANKGVAKSITAAMICEAFDEFVVEKFGKEISENIHAQMFSNGVLTVKSSSPVLSQEIKLREEEVKDTVNEKIKKDMVKSLRFVS